MAQHNLIECNGHGWAPWSIICIHLITGQSQQWESVDSTSPEVDHDWLCPTCYQNHNHEIENNLEPLRAICIHCTRKLRAKYDPNYTTNPS